jgi:peptidoglycan lytic transglycosylase G
MVALLAVAVVVVVLLSSLGGSKDSKPAPPPGVLRVLIPEGKTRAQIAQIAAREGLLGSYTAVSKHSALLDPASYGAPSSTRNLEGFLFPATYDEYSGAPAAKLVRDQLTAFTENFGPEIEAAARKQHVTPYQLLIIASMIEREARVAGDRPKIAAVIYNRLARGMPLGVDATIYYAIELQKHIPTYTSELSEEQLHIDSPYNTRTHVGLPPTPISNPGLASMQAAANPAHVPYLYYVAGADGCGEHVFSTTQSAFEANAAAYQAAVRENGGRPPTCKKK